MNILFAIEENTPYNLRRVIHNPDIPLTTGRFLITIDHFQTTRTLIEKITEYHVLLHIAFTEYFKAYDNAGISSGYSMIIRNRKN